MENLATLAIAGKMSSSGQLSDRARAFSVDCLLGASASPKKRKMVFSDTPTAKQLPKNCSTTDQLHVELVGRDLWMDFHKLGTEMIITKAGRRMFPSLKIKVHGLRDDFYYLIYVDIDPVGDRRYRYVYQSSKWAVAGPGDVPQANRRYVHGEGPQLGKFWNVQSCISFDKLKLTNSRKPQASGLIPLHSMHKYQPKIYIQAIPEQLSTEADKWKELIDPNKATCFTFEETQFVTVTAYQNQQITRLKIASNPFAKGFRDSCRENRTCHVPEQQAGYPGPSMGRRLLVPGPANVPLSLVTFWNAPCKVPLNYWIPTYPFLPPAGTRHQEEEAAD